MSKMHLNIKEEVYMLQSRAVQIATPPILLDVRISCFLSFSNKVIRCVPNFKILMVWINAELHSTNISQNRCEQDWKAAVWQQLCTRSDAKRQVVIIYWCVVCEWESGGHCLSYIINVAWFRPPWSFGLLWVRPWQTAPVKRWGCWRQERWFSVPAHEASSRARCSFIQSSIHGANPGCWQVALRDRRPLSGGAARQRAPWLLMWVKIQFKKMTCFFIYFF